jgi:hypothetical protein
MIKVCALAQLQWLTPIVIVIQEAEIRKMQFKANWANNL